GNEDGIRNAETVLQVKSISFPNDGSSETEADVTSAELSVGLQHHILTRTLDQVVAPARYADIYTTPHGVGYYEAQFYDDPDYSLLAYWRDASYGRLALNGIVTSWVDLPEAEDHYLSFGGRESDLVATIDSEIDFDGADNTVENTKPANVLATSEGDDIDSIIGIYNGLIGPGIAGYGYIDPIQLSTDEGTPYAYFIAITDTGMGSPPGVPSNYFVGLAAHEMGHNLGWYHTATPSCTFCDPWSLMSGGIYSDLGPAGPIATHRESEGWIEPDNIITIEDNGELEKQAVEFTLDMLGRPTGQNYLMAKVPFGTSGHYYTIEARKNVVNDHTPLEQTGLVVYHYSPTRHSGSMEPLAFETIVDTTGTGDLANADIDLGDSFVDTKNKITITNVAQNDDTITVKVVRGDALLDSGYDCNGMPATIVGTPGFDILEGTPGDDIMSGLGGNDVIYGLGGNDIICGGWGADTIEGGNGDDLLLGNRGSDIILGNDGNDYIIGGLGDDELDGGEGNDKVFGWSGNDVLLGGQGDDFLYGGRDDDYLLGGEGSDILTGWLGNDTYADKSDAEI
ncbi:MAG: hypothetical protein ACREBU_09960, partial [Nitrososphaera sp.]